MKKNKKMEDEVEEKDVCFVDEPIPELHEMSKRLKKIVKIIDILEFVDSCLIVGERFVKDDEEARKLIEEVREKILDVETVLTDYLISGKITKVV